jgi:hypothetical protein
MSSALANAVQRAIQRIVGGDSYPILIEAGANKTYVMDCYVPGPLKVTGVSIVTNTGTITIVVQRVRSGVTVTVGGLSALAASSTLTTTAATGDDTAVFQTGDRLQITTSANAAAVDLAVSVSIERQGGGG